MNDHSLNPVWMVFGILCAGLSVIWLGHVIVGASGPSFIYYALLTWAWIRAVDVLNRRLSPWLADAYVRFPAAWLLPIVIVLLMGAMHLSVPVLPLAVLGLLDLVVRLVVDIRRHWWGIIKSMLAGFALAVLMAAITIELQYPWLDALSPAGIGYIDGFRDAATVMAWHNYSAISHGVHGLLFEAYHSLSVMFASPFITEGFGVFSVFVFLSLIAGPALLVYGLAMVIGLAHSERIARHWPFILTVFLFTFSRFDLIFIQRSLMVATLLMIGAIPLLARMWFKRDERPMASVVILAILLPLVMFARAFHGLILLALAVPLVFVMKSFVPRIILTLGIAGSVMIVVFFFGSTVRANSTYLSGFSQLLMRDSGWFTNGWILILLPFGLFFKAKEMTPNMTIWGVIKDPYLGPIIYTCCVTLVFLLRTGGATDAAYQAIPAFLLLFFWFILAPKPLLEKHFPSGGVVNGLGANGMVYCAGFIFLSNLYLAKLDRNAIQVEERLIVQEVKAAKTHFGDEFIKADPSTCDAGLARRACELRVDGFGAHNIIEIANASMSARLARAARTHAQNVQGVTGIYIAPDHPYWAQEYHRSSLPSLYFMSVAGLPTVFGAPAENDNPAYSIMTSHRAGGTLAPLSELGGVEGLCTAVVKVGVDSVVVFEAGDETGSLVQCSGRQ